MKIYNIDNNKLRPFKSKQFKVEREIQEIVEANLEELFSIKFVKSEYSIKNFRIDTLCFDPESNSFVIVEYKRNKSFAIIDQGYTYLSLLLNNKSDFILEYNESCQKTLKRDDVDWSQSRVIFISPQFTEYQKHSVNFKDVPFELWEIKRYENNLLGMVEHKNSSNESILNISNEPDNEINKVSKEVNVYSEEYHFNKTKNKKDIVLELYHELKDRLISLGDDVEIVPRKEYIGFKRKKTFVDVILHTDYLKCYINMKTGTLDDPKSWTIDVSNKGHFGNGDYEMKVIENTDFDYLMFLIKQSYADKE